MTLTGKLGVAVILAAGLLTVRPDDAPATFPGANGRIAFDLETQFGTDVFSIASDGSDARQLTNAPGYEVDVAWSPDGQRIVFSSNAAGRSWIQTMNADGSDQVTVAEVGGEYTWPFTEPSFSPSGRRIIYTTVDAIRTVRVDGSDRDLILKAPSPLPDSRCCLYDPTYSPTGKRIAFARGPKGTRGAGIWTMRIDGTHLQRLTGPERPNFDEAPEYSPDGRSIVFKRRSDAAYVMGSDGSNETVLPGQGASSFAPNFSPAGDQLIGMRVMASSKVDVCSDLFTMALTGSTATVITSNCNYSSGPSIGSPSWQPVP